jgi:hypothetical protein
MNKFTEKQREIVARKLGYDGPMQGFDNFLNSSPALGMKYASITDKFATRMAKGGVVAKKRKYQAGGDVTSGATREQVLAAYQANPKAELNPSEESINYWMNTGLNSFNATVDSARAEKPELAASIDAARGTTATNQTSNITASLPADWSTYTPEKKVAYFNLNNISEDQLRLQDVPQSDIDYMKTIGYKGNAAFSTTPKDTTGAPMVPGATTYTAEQTATPTGATATQAAPTTQTTATQAAPAQGVSTPATVTAPTVTASTSQEAMQSALAGQQAPQGAVSAGSLMQAQQGTVSPGALATAQKVGSEFITPVVAGTRTTQAGELVTAQTDIPTVTAQVEQAAAPEKVVAATGAVQANELVTPAQIAERDMAQATAITADGLAPDATVVAARLDKFTVDDGTLAEFVKGDVDALSTVQGQLTQLMNSFNDGATPAWAAGAIRAANAAMSARGLGGSSMAGTAIFQAAMESALPIAAQDAQTFAQMGLTNLNNRQQVALANAAAQQGLSLANLNNEQQARLQNAANSFALQSQNLSNMQQTMLANTQIRATLQGQNLSNQQQAAVVNAARYAEQANINLNNIQQAALHNSSMAVQVDISNASNRQQTALANAQIEAARQGKILDNKQQAAVLNATRIAENNNLTFTAAQNAALNNSQLMKDIGLANLSAAQQTVIANAATIATMDMANLNNRQQAAVANAQAFLQMDLANLNGAQQMAVVKTQAITQSILSDTAARNAASLTNATNALEVDKLNATLSLTAQQFNAAENNKINVFNANASNELIKFNAEQANQREQFNANMSTQISLANSKLLAEVSVANTAAVNAANAVNAKNATDLSAAAYAQQSQTYRDLLSYSWKTGESDKDRITNLAIASIQKDVANIKADADSSSSLGENLVKLGVAIWG